MSNEKFETMVDALCKSGVEIVSKMSGHEAHLLHMSVGISGESGELLDAIKKHVIYRKKIDIENVIEELGDIEFYLEGLRQGLGIKREYIIEENIKKLSARYKSGKYSDEQAKSREDKCEHLFEFLKEENRFVTYKCNKCGYEEER